ncbi:Aspartate aminotransferase_ cytoplasmic [Caligus rogercresseyi]|uniref:Aspartate aminotransferase, mitochondrial n=1 Tax=Caligus rogercresseyi TaxID=217165 RepID=A0A7T8KER6_CALRO|nr:Aspartate aminotransferase_ cytoplasmic [Caligus rogercresseyi]
MSLFAEVSAAPPIEVFKLSKDFREDPSDKKKMTQKLMEDTQKDLINHDISPFWAWTPFPRRRLECFSERIPRPLLKGVHLGFSPFRGRARFEMERTERFLCFHAYLGNHNSIFLRSGFTEARVQGFDFDGMIEDLKAAPANAVIILHAVAHNPTGII